MKSYNYWKKLDIEDKEDTYTPHSQMGIKEILFLAGILGWTAIGYIVGNVFISLRARSDIYRVFLLLISIIGIVIFLFSHQNNPLSAKTFCCYLFVIGLVAFDCHRQKFYANLTIHFCNATYLGAFSYFFYLQQNTGILLDPRFWLRIAPAAPTAFNMLLLCLIFQNLGYYWLWDIFIDKLPGLNKWFSSSKNLFNFGFIKTKNDQLKTFLLLASIGLIPFIGSALTGNFFYINAQTTEDAGLSFIIASFLGQFSNLFNVAWFYGIANSFINTPQFYHSKGQTIKIDNPTMNALSWSLVGLNLAYQLISGSKGRFLAFVILPLGTVYFFARQKVSWLIFTLGVFLGGISWLIIFPLMVLYRSLIASIGVGQGMTIGNLLMMAWNNFSALSGEEYQTIIFTPFNKSGIAEQVMAMTSIVYYNVQQPAELLWQRLFLFWVPRFIWPNKPTILSGNLIGRLSGRLGEQDFNTSVVTPSSGELFLYFGLMGSILMVLPGLLMRWFNEAASPFIQFTAARVAIYFAYLGPLSHFVYLNFQSGMAGIIMQLSVLHVTLFIIRAL